MNEFNKLKEIIVNCESDIDKFNNGNKVAGTRIRKTMQEVKKQAQEIRLAVMAKKSDPPKPCSGSCPG